MNLATIRSQLLAYRNWESSGTAFDNRLRIAIWQACQRLAADCGSAFVPTQIHDALWQDQKSGDSTNGGNTDGRYAVQTADSFVLEFLPDTYIPYVNPPPAGSWIPNTDGAWDWRMHIEFQDFSGNWHRRQCLEFWTVVGGGPTLRLYVSLDRPFSDADHTDFLMPFRIHQPYFALNSETRKMKSVTLWTESKEHLLTFANQSANQRGMWDFRGDTTGRPRVFTEGPHLQIPSPNYLPTASVNAQDPWIGPENAGQFEFRYTYIAGKRYAEWQESWRADRDPLYESYFSEAATATQTELEGGGFGTITIQLPEIDWMRNFNVAGTLRATHSGLRKRIYVCRKTVLVGAPGAHDNVESGGDVYYLLAEVDGDVTSYTWDGSTTPDHSRKLPLSSGYYLYKVWPHNDQYYELDIMVERDLVPLVYDNDVLPVRQDAFPALFEIALYYASLLDGIDEATAAVHLSNYMTFVGRINADHGNRAPVILRNSWFADGAPAAYPGWNITRLP